jgi:hypothetical protein
MPSTEEQAAKRAAQLKRLAALPEHLRLGVTLPGMRALLSELPSDKLERVNAHVEKVNAERVKKDKPTYPKNDAFNGYRYQYWITKWATRRPRRASRRGTGSPCASGCSSRGRRTWARPPCS